MFNFHKPRVYRSADGCCICRAKSSSSRFTASRKYEKESMQCFNLHEPRNGEICNACVLLVKRYKRLPVGSKRHWGHVVDARAGPGTKSLAKQKKRENEIEAKMGGGGGSSLTEKFAKILKKNRKVKTTATTIAAAVAPSNDNQTQLLAISPHSEEQPSDSNESYDDEHQQLQQQQQQQQQQLQVHSMATTVAVAAPSLAFAATPYQTRKRTAAAALATTATIATTTGTTRTTTTAAAACNMNNSRQPRVRLTGSKRRRMLEPMKHRRAVDNVPFFEEHDLLRLDVCCGTVFQSLSLGSTCYIIDPELYKPCEKHRRRGRQQQQLQQQQQLLQQTEIELETKPAPSQVISTPALKKHHLFFKRQSESFPQGEIHRISPIPLHKTEAMPATTATITTATVHQQHQQQQQQQPPPQHSTATNGGSLSLILKSGASAAGGGGGGGGATAAGTGLHANMLTTATAATTTTNNTTAVGAASPSSLSSSSNCSTSSSVATKFNDNSSDSGFDEHVLDRKSVSPPTQDELQLDNKKLRGGMQRLILASGLPISGQTQNLVLTGNEFTARFVQRQQQTPTQSLKITATATAAAAATTTTKTNGTTTIATGSQSSGNCNKMRAIFNNANTIQHENGVTTILPASSLAASNQTAAMNAIAPSTVTITPAKITINNNNINNPTNTIVANNPKFILLKPAIGKTPTEVKIA